MPGAVDHDAQRADRLRGVQRATDGALVGDVGLRNAALVPHRPVAGDDHTKVGAQQIQPIAVRDVLYYLVAAATATVP